MMILRDVLPRSVTGGKTAATIVHMDNDCEVHEHHIADLLDCPHPLCTWQFHLHWASGCYPSKLIQEDDGTGFSDYSPMGLVKIRAEARILWQMPHHWRDTEMAMCACVTGRWHLHGPDHRGANGQHEPQSPLTHHHW